MRVSNYLGQIQCSSVQAIGVSEWIAVSFPAPLAMTVASPAGEAMTLVYSTQVHERARTYIPRHPSIKPVVKLVWSVRLSLASFGNKDRHFRELEKISEFY